MVCAEASSLVPRISTCICTNVKWTYSLKNVRHPDYDYYKSSNRENFLVGQPHCQQCHHISATGRKGRHAASACSQVDIVLWTDDVCLAWFLCVYAYCTPERRRLSGPKLRKTRLLYNSRRDDTSIIFQANLIQLKKRWHLSYIPSQFDLLYNPRRDDTSMIFQANLIYPFCRSVILTAGPTSSSGGSQWNPAWSRCCTSLVW